jgi:hypothetical protein
MYTITSLPNGNFLFGKQNQPPALAGAEFTEDDLRIELGRCRLSAKQIDALMAKAQLSL